MRFRSLFDFPKPIRWGILLLSLLVLALELLIFCFDFSRFTPDPETSLGTWKAFKARVLRAEKRDSRSKEHPLGRALWEPPRKTVRKAPLTGVFDPDRLDQKGWVKRGFSKAQARSILKYKRSLGGFKNEAQLRRSYVISEEKFREIQPFIRFSKPGKTDEKPRRSTPAGQIAYRPFDLNTVSLRDLKALRPLRRVAAPLFHYRELLGGYVRFSQLREVYAMDTTALGFLRKYARIDPAAVHRIDLNRVDFKTLLRHPYFNRDRVEQIFQLRNRGGHFRSLEPLKNLPAFKGADFDKIKLYLKSD